MNNYLKPKQSNILFILISKTIFFMYDTSIHILWALPANFRMDYLD